MSDAIVSAAERAAERPFYLASAFAAWRARAGGSAGDLLAYLGAEPDSEVGADQQLARLALCRKPTDAEDRKQIAARFGVDPDRLAEVVAAEALPGRRRSSQRGERHPRARLTAELVAELRRRVAGGERISAVAASNRLPVETVRDAVTGATWRDVLDPPPVALVVQRPWSDVELAYLREHEDDQAPDVAEVLGRTPNAVRHMRSKLGL